MPVEVKQLTINSVFQREEIDVADTDSEETAKEKKKAESVDSSTSCLDTEQVNPEVLAACKKLIRHSIHYRLVR